MNQRSEIIEKLRVQFSAAAGLVAVYFFLWQTLASRDPLWPITFIAEGNIANLAVFTAILLGLAVFTSLLTLGLRPAGPLLATLIAAGALSLRCPQARTLLWAHQDNLAWLFTGMIVEILLLTASVALAALVISSIRYAAGRINPKWRWHGEEIEPAEEALRTDWIGELFALEVQSVISLLGKGKSSRRQAASGMLAKSLYCFLTGLVIANVVLLVVMQSPLRGQIIFALMVSFFVAALAAYRTFDVSSCVPAIAMALVSAVGLYTLAAFMSISGTSAWMSVPIFAKALPIDYLTAGGGGAVLGYWINCRVNQAKVAEQRKLRLQEQ